MLALRCPLRRRARAALIPTLLLGAVAGCRERPPAPPTTTASAPGGIAPEWAFTGQARITYGREALVVSGHPIASAVGLTVLQRGGNAIDAAVAVGFALAVVHPEAGNIGGGGFLLLRTQASEVHALDFRETAPARARRDMYRGADGKATDRSVTGHLSAGVPGSVAGLAEAHRKFGRLPWRDLVEPAVALAREGFDVDEYRSRSISGDSARLVRFPASAAAFLPGGRPPQPRQIFQQPDLGRTLEAIRDRGADGFYQGRIADLIVAEMQRGRGLITHADLAAYRPVWREPVRLTYRGYTLYSMPPPSSGGITLGMILNILEGWDHLPAFGSPALIHLEAEAMRRAFTDRNRWLGDPDFVTMPVERLLSKAYAAELRRGIDTGRATPSAALATGAEPEHTTHYSIVDVEGNAVAVTTTLNNSYGSAVTVTGAGFLLNDEMDDFTTAPGQPNLYGLIQGEANAIAPRKRMLSAMTPTIVLDPAGELLLVAGTPGGPTIITQVYHVISNVLDHGMSLADAVAAPRTHHQALPDRIQVETGGFPEATLAALRALGHEIGLRQPTGEVEAIIRAEGTWIGVSDPRRGGGGAGY
jgi:gamma-glutamyltranspeptidase/glutathione hydrolase